MRMPLLRPVLTTLLILTTAANVQADDDSEGLKDHQAIREKTEHFMDRLNEGRVLAAYKDMKAILGVDSEPFMEDAEKARKFFGQVRDRVGEPLESARVRRESIDGHFHRQSYLQKFESAALHWQFTFYRPADEWVLVGVSYSTDLEALYQRD